MNYTEYYNVVREYTPTDDCKDKKRDEIDSCVNINIFCNENKKVFNSTSQNEVNENCLKDDKKEMKDTCVNVNIYCDECKKEKSMNAPDMKDECKKEPKCKNEKPCVNINIYCMKDKKNEW